MVKMRGHHLICLYFFEGKGYDKGFLKNLKKTISSAKNNPIRICRGPDDICKACPHLKAERCSYSEHSEEEINNMDTHALTLTAFKEGAVLKWNHIKELLPQLFPIWYKRYCRFCHWRWACEENTLYKKLLNETTI